jgi:ATP-binding cassette subfamily B protein
MKEKLMHKYALSSQGAKDMIKAFISVTISDLILMIPVSLLYFLVKDYMEGNLAGRGGFYIAGVIITLVLIAVSTYIQYNATFLSTYVESGVRRITLAEKLRKIPLSFFGKKDLSDLTSTIMADCAQMETASSHFIPELVGACISTAFVAIGLFFFDWRMAIAALWVLPISFIIVSCSGKVQRKLNEKQVALKMTCADGIQECLESVRDIRAYNTQEEYMKGLDEKIKAVEKHAVSTELGTAVFVGSAQMILKLGIATVALVGGALLASGKLDVITFFMFLMVVSRIYDPMQVSLQNLAAIIASDVQSARLDEILSHVSEGSEYLVALYIDKSGRLAATMRINKYLEKSETLVKDSAVTGTIIGITPDYRAYVAVEDKYDAFIPMSEVFEPLSVGEVIHGRVSRVREDGKLVISLKQKAYIQMDEDSVQIYDAIVKKGGSLGFTDKADPEIIKKHFNMSKNAFKRAVGRLLKEGKIEITQNSIVLKK